MKRPFDGLFKLPCVLLCSIQPSSILVNTRVSTKEPIKFANKISGVVQNLYLLDQGVNSTKQLQVQVFPVIVHFSGLEIRRYWPGIPPTVVALDLNTLGSAKPQISILKRYSMPVSLSRLIHHSQNISFSKIAAYFSAVLAVIEKGRLL